jgi:predicted DsbA family dithiol-disulfide isomerase
VRTERLQRTLDVDVSITQFPLHPDTPAAGLTLEQLFAGRRHDVAAAQARMEQLMAAEGLPYGRRTHTYNSRFAQELAKWGEQLPGGAEIHDALFRAYFVDGINLADPDRLLAIAGSVGLPVETAREVLATRSFRSHVDRDWQRSRAAGVTGVPTFSIGARRLVGAVSYEELRRLAVAAGAVGRR